MNAKLTVPALKTLASDMGITVPSKALKADIVALIMAEIERLHAEAIEIEKTVALNNATFDAIEQEMRDAEDEYNNRQIDAETRTRNRVQNYMNANGTDKLTKRQLRRIRKNANRTGINPWAYSFRYSFNF